MSVELRGEVWTLRSQVERNQQSRLRRSSKYKDRKTKRSDKPKIKRRKHDLEGIVLCYTSGSQPGVVFFPQKGIWQYLETFLASLMDQSVKNLPAMQKTWVWSLGWEDSPENRMATPSRIPAWDISWTEEPGRLQSMKRKSWLRS